MDQGTFYFSQTAMSQPDLTNGALLSFTAAAQQTKKSITNSFISRKPIEFYVKSIFQNKSIMDEYNFYKETNINKIKLFLENFLNELSKPPSFNSRESFAFHPERMNTYGSNYKSTESKGVSIEIVSEQMNELKSCLKHFTKSLSEINHAELEYMESIEKANLSRFTQKYKVNKQVLFQESENLIVFTNNLIQYLEMLNLNVNEEAVKIVAPENTTAFSVTDLETKEDVKTQDKMTQTVPSSPKQKAEKSIISKDTSGVTTPKKMSSEMVSLAEESLYSTGVHKTANFPTVSQQKSMEESQVSSVQKEAHEQHEQYEQQENFSLNDVQNVQSRVTEDNTEDKIAQLLQLNKMLGTELQMKDDALRHTKTIFLKEVQDSNNLRVQLTNMIEDNIELKQKLEEAITLNDEFERTLVEKDQQLQENLNYTEHELAKIEAFYEERIEALTRRILELDDEIKILRRQNLELKTMNIELSRHKAEGGFQISEAESGEQG